MAYYQLEDGSVYTAKQYKRRWPGGKAPSPAARRILGIKVLTKKQYEAAKQRGNPSKTGRWVDPMAQTRKMKAYKPVKKRSKKKGSGKNPSHRKGTLTQARAAAKIRLQGMPLGSIVMVGQWLDTGKHEAKTGGGSNWAHKMFMPVEQWTSVPYKTKPGKKMVKVDIPKGKRKNPYRSFDRRELVKHTAKYDLYVFYRKNSIVGWNIVPKGSSKPTGFYVSRSHIEDIKGVKFPRSITTAKMKKNPHPSSMFNEDKPDWLIYAKAPGMSRYEPLDLSEGGTVKNLIYATRFPYSQEAKVDSIIAKLRKQAPHIKVEKRSATGTRKNPKRKVYDPFTGKMVPVKPLKVQMGGGLITSGGKVVYDGRKKKTKKKAVNPPPLPSTVIPAYGHDYKTKAKAVQSWEDGKDWIIADHFSPWDGKPISIRDFPLGSSVNLRYDRGRKVTRYTHGSSGAQRLKKAPRKARRSFADQIKTYSMPELEDLMMELRQKLTKQRPGTPKQKALLKKYIAVSDRLHSRL